MAKIVSLKLVEPPGHRGSGARGDNVVAVFEAKVDEVLPGPYVLALAQELTGTLPTGNNPDGSKVNEVPNPGDRFMYSSTLGIVSDTYANGNTGIAAFLADTNVTGSKYYDAGINALDFTTELLEGCNTDWQIVVSYRPPEPGQNERRVQLTQLLAGRDGTSATPAAIPFTGTDFDASVERWIEQRPIRVPVTEAYAVNGGAPATVLSQMTLPNGEQFPPLEIDLMVDVLVIARNVQNEAYASDLNAQYLHTTNNAALNLGGRNMVPYTAHYEVTRTGRPIARNNSTYYRAETRIVLYTSPRFIKRQAVGTYYIDNPGGVWRRFKLSDEDGEPLPFAPLDNNGRLAQPDGSDIAVRTYSQQKPVSYAAFAYT